MTIQADTLSESPHFLPIGTINGVKFTHREIDIIACLLGRRTAKKIASFLSISPKTAENHIRNIMQKLECNSRESIIDFIEDSDEALILKKYHTSLLWRVSFEERLKEVSVLIGKKASSCHIVYWPEEKYHTNLAHLLGKDLKRIGVNVTIEARSELVSLDLLTKDMERSENSTLYVLPKVLRRALQTAEGLAKISAKEGRDPNNLLYLIFERESKVKTLQSFPIREKLSLEEQKTYYYSFFEMLRSLFPTLQLDEFFVKLRRLIEGVSDFSETKPLHMSSTVKQFKENQDFFILHPKSILKIKEWTFSIVIMVLLIFCLSTELIFFKTNRKQNKNYQTSQEVSISSDLAVPAKSVFLNRPELISQLDGKLRGQGDIQTVALVGPGGAGKTTMARQYAREHKANVIWEINAETKGSLRGSFENLGQTLSKTEEDKQLLKKIGAIKNPKEREEKLIFFVQERLRAHSNWLLIYDNVESIMGYPKIFSP